MDKTFEPASVEKRIADLWEREGAFKAGRPERAGAQPYTIVIPPPNVTGSLHMGHALNNTLQDILCRFERMRGKDVLWQPGTDHAGIATQMVVERQLMEKQLPGRREMGREAFVKRIWEWKAESGGVIVNQLKRLGASCDWSRERFTMDEGLSRAVLKVFVALHKQGLIYRDKRLVNWDPKFQTAISDLEVVQVEKKGSFKWERPPADAEEPKPLDLAALGKLLDRDASGHLFYFDYPLEGAAYDPADAGTFIRIATTRPETMLGDTAIAVHPENETLKQLIGRNVVLPLVGRVIPIVADDYADPEKGTGAVKITPAHDFNDFEVGKRHGLPVINVLDAEAAMLLAGNAAFLAGAAPEAGVLALQGVDRFEARKRIVALMAGKDLLAKIEPTGHTVPHGDRSNVVIEPWLTDQWYVDAKTLAQPAMAAVRDGRTKFVPENWEKTYFQWLENIEPWCVSRQLWWGHQIPVWYGPSRKPNNELVLNVSFSADSDARTNEFVGVSEAEAIGEASRYYGKPVVVVADQREAMLHMREHPTDDVVAIWRDEDVLDTWFSSALWPFSTLGWPDQTPELARHYPTDVLVTGFDIIFFWVARMMMMGLHFMEEIPFHTVYIHALVRDEKGAKMSKSKGNVIDPLELVDSYGADALRFTLAAMAAQGRDIKLSRQRVEGYRNFATKLWNAARFAEMNECARVAGFDPAATTLPLNRWALAELNRAVGDVTAAIEAYRFNDAANAAYRFVWNVFCDWYLELAKPVFTGENAAEKAETRASVAYVLDAIARLLHPFMPFLTEELWAIKGQEGPTRESILALAPWPADAGIEAPDAQAEIGWVVALIDEIRSARQEVNVPGAAQIPLVLVDAGAETRVRAERWAEMLKRLARLSDISFADVAPGESVQLVVHGEVAALPLAGIVDIAAETLRLSKEITKLKGEVAKIDAKLGNADFLARAPEEVVDEQRERREDAEARIAKMAEALERLKKD
ncbi:valine--tRNA ligase [Alsobacter metallidurans]|uniref:Valine--tRNA ligase n=1 Tax=Alsobacter metallidurans TaxID=340221 RepID=A0A917MIC7_9HYPH|nr:valine--tRNA ligase [Alsobacter metallidurans]GGH22571.1 valine--tRNA ligase [Alsobacter metallidurans]